MRLFLYMATALRFIAAVVFLAAPVDAKRNSRANESNSRGRVKMPVIKESNSSGAHHEALPNLKIWRDKRRTQHVQSSSEVGGAKSTRNLIHPHDDFSDITDKAKDVIGSAKDGFSSKMIAPGFKSPLDDGKSHAARDDVGALQEQPETLSSNVGPASPRFRDVHPESVDEEKRHDEEGDAESVLDASSPNFESPGEESAPDGKKLAIASKKHCERTPGVDAGDNEIVSSLLHVREANALFVNTSLGLTATSLTAKSHWDENYLGGRRCDSLEWKLFSRRWKNPKIEEDIRNWQGNLELRKEVDKIAKCKFNVLWMYPGHDFNKAFEIDSFVCHRMMAWQRVACSIRLVRVESIPDAQKILEEYQPGTIAHLVLGGHGTGSTLHWGDGYLGKLRAHHTATHEFLKFAASRLKFGGTVFLDSCFAGTLHEMENLAHYTTRIMTSAMKCKVGKSCKNALILFASIHSLSNQELHVEYEDGELLMVNAHGSQKYVGHKNEEQDVVKENLAKADWVRSYCHARDRFGKRGKSRETNVGFVISVGKGEVKIKFQDGKTQTVDIDWVVMAMKPGSECDALPNGPGFEKERAEFLGPAGHYKLAKVKFADKSTKAIPAKYVTPLLIERSGVVGVAYPRVGDWVRVQLFYPTPPGGGDEQKTKETYGGIVSEDTKYGAKIILGSLGSAKVLKMVKEKTTTLKIAPVATKTIAGKRIAIVEWEAEVQDIIVIAKPGGSVLTHYMNDGILQDPAMGVLKAGDGKKNGKAAVLFGDNITLVDPDWIVSVNSQDGNVLFRTSSGSSCACKRNTKRKLYKIFGHSVDCESDFCCKARRGDEQCEPEDPDVEGCKPYMKKNVVSCRKHEGDTPTSFTIDVGEDDFADYRPASWSSARTGAYIGGGFTMASAMFGLLVTAS